MSLRARARRGCTSLVALLLAALHMGAPAVVPTASAQPRPDNVPLTPPPPPPGRDATLDSARALRGADITVAIYTYGHGNEVFEKFGHIALGVANAATGEDIAFNWGMFDFDQPNFLGRFLTGDTRYWMAGYNTAQFNAAYQAEDRAIRKQVLALTPVQRGALYDFVAWNAQEENRYYRYDYYNDNCSTRIRDAIDWALGGTLQQALGDVNGHYTWRDETARITATDLPVYVGIQVALGRNADRHLTRWQQAFLPEYLAAYLPTVQVNGASLVQADTVLYAAQRAPLPAAAPRRTVAGAVVGVLLGVLVVILARMAPPAVLTAFGVLWYGVGGVLGTALLLAGTVTKHEPYMGSNLTLTLLSPLLLVAAVFWVWRGRASRRGRAARALSAVVAVVGVGGLVLMHVPGFHQQSFLLMFAILPVHGALAAVAGMRSRRAAVRA
jgi:hypothetical protein